MEKPILLVSLDFELYWGVCSSRVFDEYKDNISGARKAIPRLLSLFTKHNIHATWATVGFLFAKDYEEAKKFFPKGQSLPTYENQIVNSYNCFKSMASDNNYNQYFYADSLIKEIIQTEGQEIGSHTFSHYFCKENGQTVDQFREDIESAKRIAIDKGINLHSIVLPRNQCAPQYTKELNKLGFSSYRDEENDWIHTKVKCRPLMRLLRLLDVYFPLTGQGGYIPKKENGIWNFTGSRMYKPYYKPLAFMDGLKIRRIKKQMHHAAKNNLVFHFWWHPHNIGVRTDYHMKRLEDIFCYYDKLKEKYGMVSMNMQEACDYFSKEG